MDKRETNIKEYYAVDLLHIVKSLWHRAWAIALSGILVAVIGFLASSFVIAPKYSSSILLYVNNSSFSLGNTSFSISSSEITAAQSLVKTYSVLLNNRTTLERIIEKTNVPYTYKELSKMITAAPSNETEIMCVTVTTEDPYEAARIANCIAEVLPIRISEIIDGASMEVVDSAVPELDKISPSITKYTAVGLILGVLLASIILAVAAMLDDTIHDEDYILKTYDYPILAKIPDLLTSGKSKYGYYYSQNNRKSHS
ncbi:MAG: hypothetical protein IKD04_02610 [Clostridia bacterium]|nr:hypothetical protein [Clostridia bacterium]